jgi:hypothetical protein
LYLELTLKSERSAVELHHLEDRTLAEGAGYSSTAEFRTGCFEMMKIIRILFLTLIVLAGLSLTAILLALPGRELQLTGGSFEVPSGPFQVSGMRSTIDTRVHNYGLMNYLTIVDELGTAQSQGRSFQLEPLRTFLTCVLFLEIWAGVGWLFYCCRSTAKQAARVRVP